MAQGLIKIWMLFILCLFLFSCDRRTPTQVDAESSVLQFTGEKISLPGSAEYQFRQTAILQLDAGEDNLFAWRITTTDSLLPEGVVADPEGWICFYANGADTSVPLDAPNCQTTIWTSAAQQEWTFGSVDNKLPRIVSKVEVRVRRPGAQEITYEQNFRTDRLISTSIIVPFPNYATIGLGFQASLREQTTDIYVEGMYAHHYMYRLNTVDSDLNLVYEGVWQNSINGENIRELKITGLVPNYTAQYTQLEVYVVTRQGIEESTHKSVYFKVQTGFHPKTLIYHPMISALGQYHYSYKNDFYPPGFYYTNDNTLWNTNLFRNADSWCAINSPDLKLRLSFGWDGQYGFTMISYTTVTNYPFDTILNQCLDETTGQNYFSRIEYFDLRMGGSPFPNVFSYGASTLVTHSDNTQWRRVKYTGEGAFNVMLTGLPDGIHIIEAAAVDDQGVYDPTPATMMLELNPYIEISNRSGILIIDDEHNNANFAPEARIDSIYYNILPTAYGSVQQFDIQEHFNMSDAQFRRLSASLLQQYDAVVYHSDYPTQTSNFSMEIDPITIYLNMGGKLILSGGSNIYSTIVAINQRSPLLMQNILSTTLAPNMTALTFNMVNKSYFVSAVAEYGNLNDVPLNLSRPVSLILNTRQGLGPVTYFSEGTGLAPLYKFGCKLPTAAAYPPTQAEYDDLITKHVALKKEIAGGGKFVLFGFPLSYMEEAPMAQALSTLINDLMQ